MFMKTEVNLTQHHSTLLTNSNPFYVQCATVFVHELQYVMNLPHETRYGISV